MHVSNGKAIDENIQYSMLQLRLNMTDNSLHTTLNTSVQLDNRADNTGSFVQLEFSGNDLTGQQVVNGLSRNQHLGALLIGVQAHGRIRDLLLVDGVEDLLQGR
eukprot:TRINITY_DN10435_c0_g2_i3.p5 TRINITY_DN10435_c0_g2~~TRINITY_DN10435_c0_g2_i3.p5  ORF type:complete len:104 (-),score=12.84 TRINITY_DN10435_c0_g2_i3:2420-2731(-)